MAQMWHWWGLCVRVGGWVNEKARSGWWKFGHVPDEPPFPRRLGQVLRSAALSRLFVFVLCYYSAHTKPLWTRLIWSLCRRYLLIFPFTFCHPPVLQDRALFTDNFSLQKSMAHNERRLLFPAVRTINHTDMEVSTNASFCSWLSQLWDDICCTWKGMQICSIMLL